MQEAQNSQKRIVNNKFTRYTVSWTFEYIDGPPNRSEGDGRKSDRSLQPLQRTSVRNSNPLTRLQMLSCWKTKNPLRLAFLPVECNFKKWHLIDREEGAFKMYWWGLATRFLNIICKKSDMCMLGPSYLQIEDGGVSEGAWSCHQLVIWNGWTRSTEKRMHRDLSMDNYGRKIVFSGEANPGVPYLQRGIALMECLQHLATRLANGVKESPYEEWFRPLNIFFCGRPRLRGDLILAYNIFHGRLDFPQVEFVEAPVERNLRGHDFLIRPRSFRLLQRKAAYSVRLPGPWTNQSDGIVIAPTLDTFKRLLDVAWPSLFRHRPWLSRFIKTCHFTLF